MTYQNKLKIGEPLYEPGLVVEIRLGNMPHEADLQAIGEALRVLNDIIEKNIKEN